MNDQLEKAELHTKITQVQNDLAYACAALETADHVGTRYRKLLNTLLRDVSNLLTEIKEMG